VFAWAEDVKFAIPTNFEPGAIQPQADEYGKKPVSRIAGAVANAASYLTQVPMIGPFARATEIGAQAIGAIATLFGYSSPVMLETSIYRPVNVANIATCNVPNESMKLTVDCKQELTLDPRTVGLEGHDELTIKSIAQRESWMVNFPWELGTQQETLLWNHVVDPCLHYRQGSEIHMPAVCFAATPFRYWRGTLKFRFQFVCSRYHKGRVKIVYDPTGTPQSGSAEYNTAYTTIVDISDKSDFEIAVGWGQRTPYREHFLPGVDAQATMWDNVPLTLTTPNSDIGNGTLSVYVVNELTVPNSTINNDIEVNVFISAGDDFEVAVPDGRIMEQLRLRTATAFTSPQSMEIQEIEPHSMEMETDSKPSDVNTIDMYANTVSKSDETNLVYFGESIHSFRQLLKRYCRHSIISGSTLGPGLLVRLRCDRYAFPFQIGYKNPTALAGGGVVFPLNAGAARYAYGQTTLLNYLTPAYAGWRGSIRWLVDMTRFDATDETCDVIVTRQDSCANDENYVSLVAETWTSQGQAAIVNQERTTGRTFDGSLYQSTKTNPAIMFEVPYYKNTRFTPAKRLDNPGVVDDLQNGWNLTAVMRSSNRQGTEYAQCFVSAGEDFNCFFFLGAPIMYYEPNAPQS
jgi:hypothetical protein